MSKCEVLVDRREGVGICLGDEPLRSYCLAVLDALMYGGEPVSEDIHLFLSEHRQKLEHDARRDFNLILRTKVDFKLMEQE